MWKSFQKMFDSQESFVSMALGLAVVLAIGVLIVNYMRQGKSVSIESGETTQEETVTTPPGGSHTVKAGETLWSIAENSYKSGYNWVDIAKANNLTNPDMIEAGQTLTIPDVKPIVIETKGQIAAASSVESGKTEKKTYTVVRGDDLWNIAVKEYGSGYEWTKIAQANKLANANLIHSGNVLTLP